MKIYIKDIGRFKDISEEYSYLHENLKNEKDPIKYQKIVERIKEISDELASLLKGTIGYE